jgi:hypothetical protein
MFDFVACLKRISLMLFLYLKTIAFSNQSSTFSSIALAVEKCSIKNQEKNH